MLLNHRLISAIPAGMKKRTEPAPRSRYVSASPVGWVANGRTLIFVGQPVIHWRTHHAARSRPTAPTIHLTTNLLYPGGMTEISRWLSASDTTGSDLHRLHRLHRLNCCTAELLNRGQARSPAERTEEASELAGAREIALLNRGTYSARAVAESRCARQYRTQLVPIARAVNGSTNQSIAWLKVGPARCWTAASPIASV